MKENDKIIIKGARVHNLKKYLVGNPQKQTYCFYRRVRIGQVVLGF